MELSKIQSRSMFLISSGHPGYLYFSAVVGGVVKPWRRYHLQDSRGKEVSR